MERIFVVLSCEIVGRDRVPAMPRTVFPVSNVDAVKSATADAKMDTVPPEVYPAGMVTVPDLVEIVPPVAPLFGILPVTAPLLPYAVFPDRISPASAVPLDAS